MRNTDSANPTIRRQYSAHRPTRLVPWLFFLLFALMGGAFFFGGVPDLSPSVDSVPAAINPVAASPAAPQYVTKEIRDIGIFDWVLATNPELTDAERAEFPEIQPAAWRLVTLEMPKPDGGRLDITLARPLEWLITHTVAPGATIDLDLPEMGAEGPAQVRSIGPCPTRDPKPDPRCRLVTGLFRHTTADVRDVSVAGQSKPIGTTPAHPFWSEDRQAFIPAGQLCEGERLRTAHGAITQVTRIAPRPTSEPVYNLEVDVEHVYYVTADALLVHNSYLRFEIEDGVRRSKAASMHGHEKIRARIYDKNGKLIMEDNVPISALRSPKSEISLTSETDVERWRRANAGAAGAAETGSFPWEPIKVHAGSDGVPIPDVGVGEIE
jgi:hypothetical protein